MTKAGFFSSFCMYVFISLFYGVLRQGLSIAQETWYSLGSLGWPFMILLP